MNPSYDREDIERWGKLSPEERLFEAESLWEEFCIKYPAKHKPFWRSFESFEDYHRWLKETKDPSLW